MTSETDRFGDVPNTAVCGMVQTLEPEWSVESIDRVTHGVNFVATLGVRTPTARTVVLKATTTDLVPEVARSEPRLLELVGRETDVPVPSVIGTCNDHEDYPTPFYLMDHIAGENYEGHPERLTPDARERVLREAGRNLAELHALGPLPAAGTIGVHDGDLTVIATDDHPQYDDFRDWLLRHVDWMLDRLTNGGYFPELAEQPTRFADLVPDLRQYVRETIPKLSEPEQPTYCHRDYRYGNLLVDPKTGKARAVLDWADLLSADPAYNLASTESLLLNPDTEGDEYTQMLRHAFRTAYTQQRECWAFDRETHKRMRLYRLACRVNAMACFPLWYQDATPEERAERETEHWAFVAQYVV